MTGATLVEVFAAEEARGTLSPRALIREAYDRRKAEDDTLTHERLAERASMHREVVTRAISEDTPCPVQRPHQRGTIGCKTCGGSGRIASGEPRPETVARILRALGYAMVIVEVKR